MNGMNADEDADEENGNSLKAKGFWYDARFVEVEFPRASSDPRLVIEYREVLRLLLEDAAAVPLVAQRKAKAEAEVVAEQVP